MKEVDVSSLEHTSWRCQYHVVFAPIILGKSIKEIAKAEGVHEESIRQSIKRGLERMKKTF